MSAKGSENQEELAATELRASLPARLIRRLMLAWFERAGWTAEGRLPAARKFVLMGAPHTSNWDFLVFLGTVEALGLTPRFIGKDSLFRGPMGNFMRGLGGVPVDRGASQDMVAQMATRIRAADDYALVIAPEGTRAPTGDWRSGFYRIALAAGVPILCVGPDYKRRRGVLGPLIEPTGDFDRDMEPAWAFFRTLAPKHPERALFPDGYGMEGPKAK